MPDWLQIPLPELFALLAAIAFAAGLNVYATVAALGLLARLDIFHSRQPWNSSKAGP